MCAVMTSTKEQIEVSYDVSNEFFELWLDENMHYTSASFLTGDETLEQAQIQKCKILADYAEIEKLNGQEVLSGLGGGLLV